MQFVPPAMSVQAVLPFAAGTFARRRAGLPGAVEDEIRLRSVGAGRPVRRATGLPRIARPPLAARLARGGHRVEPPDALPGLRIVRVEEAPPAELTPGDAGDDLVLDD